MMTVFGRIPVDGFDVETATMFVIVIVVAVQLDATDVLVEVMQASCDPSTITTAGRPS